MGTTEPAAAAPTVEVVLDGFVDEDLAVAAEVGVAGVAKIVSEVGVGGLAVCTVVVGLTLDVVETVEILSAKAFAICAATRAQSWCKADGFAVWVIGIGATKKK